jgi:hypothetical protein
MYDLRIQEYSLPLLRPNLEVDQKYVGSKYFSDAFLSEETPIKPPVNQPVLEKVKVKQNSSDSDEPARVETSPDKLIIEEENPQI